MIRTSTIDRNIHKYATQCDLVIEKVGHLYSVWDNLMNYYVVDNVPRSRAVDVIYETLLLSRNYRARLV